MFVRLDSAAGTRNCGGLGWTPKLGRSAGGHALTCSWAAGELSLPGACSSASRRIQKSPAAFRPRRRTGKTSNKRLPKADGRLPDCGGSRESCCQSRTRPRWASERPGWFRALGEACSLSSEVRSQGMPACLRTLTRRQEHYSILHPIPPGTTTPSRVTQTLLLLSGAGWAAAQGDWPATSIHHIYRTRRTTTRRPRPKTFRPQRARGAQASPLDRRRLSPH